MQGARETVGRLLGAGDGEVVFGPNSTTLVLGYTRALGRLLGPGDRIVCTQLDHDSNVSTWMAMAEYRYRRYRLGIAFFRTGYRPDTTREKQERG